KARRLEALKMDDDVEFARLDSKLKEARRRGDPDRVPLASVVETAPAPDQPMKREASPLLTKMVRIGMHPTDEVGISKIPSQGQPSSQFQWQNLFVDNGINVTWITKGDSLAIGEARLSVAREQRPLIDDVLFSKTYF